jgi:uncharacterized membrane protein YtjA (UPF0391 family)
VTALLGQLAFSVRGRAERVATLRQQRVSIVARWCVLLRRVAAQRGGLQRRSRKSARFPSFAQLWHGTCSETASSAAPQSERTSSLEEPTMLHWAAVFLVIALIAALFGFGGIAAGAAGIAKVLFVLFIILALVAFVVGRRAPI